MAQAMAMYPSVSIEENKCRGGGGGACGVAEEKLNRNAIIRNQRLRRKALKQRKRRPA